MPCLDQLMISAKDEPIRMIMAACTSTLSTYHKGMYKITTHLLRECKKDTKVDWQMARNRRAERDAPSNAVSCTRCVNTIYIYV